jgi:S1-C subfamily serine protease
MTQALVALSGAISQIVDSTAPLLGAIRTAPNRHIVGLVCQGDTIVTTDQALPALDSYTVVLSNRMPVAARPGPRDPNANLAILRMDTPWPGINPQVATTTVGSLVIVLGAEADSSPTVRLTVVHRFARTATGLAPVLDLPSDRVQEGSLVLDAGGRLIGLAAAGPNGEAMAVPCDVIGRMLMTDPAGDSMPPAPPAHAAAPFNWEAQPASRSRGWLGVALQPIIVPNHLVARAGQTSGRMVVSITKGGPADMAGMHIGDVLLALDGTSASGPHALRAFLEAERVGTTVAVKLLRDGVVSIAKLMIAAQPG